jgi:hypothetical protein
MGNTYQMTEMEAAVRRSLAGFRRMGNQTPRAVDIAKKIGTYPQKVRYYLQKIELEELRRKAKKMGNNERSES